MKHKVLILLIFNILIFTLVGCIDNKLTVTSFEITNDNILIAHISDNSTINVGPIFNSENEIIIYNSLIINELQIINVEVDDNYHLLIFLNNETSYNVGTINKDLLDEQKLLNDKIKPFMRIIESEREIFIKQGQEYDLLTGIEGIDNLEGNITNKIIINDEGFDPNVPGVYYIIYFLSDLAGNSAIPIERKITVLDSGIFQKPPVYLDVIVGEASKPNNPQLFGGAWYHKVVSSRDKWTGIEGTITLPNVKITRYDGAFDENLDFDPQGKNLDNPSVYMGGHATNESDVGLSFSKGLIDISKNTLSKGSIVFRPFWRYITSDSSQKDIGGYDLKNGRRYAVSATNAAETNMIANWHYADTEFYYLPGDKLRMLIFSPEPNKLQMQIEVIEKSTFPESIAMRELYGWKDPEDFKSPIFHSPGHGTNINAEYKRVNAIDQSGNEGKDAIDTTTLISNAIWHEVYLYRTINNVLYRVPFTEERRGFLSAKNASKFTISYDGVDKNLGGEVITIHPGYSN